MVLIEYLLTATLFFVIFLNAKTDGEFMNQDKIFADAKMLKSFNLLVKWSCFTFCIIGLILFIKTLINFWSN